MKLLKTGIYRIIILIFSVAATSNAAGFWINAGVYNFSNDISRQFYKFGWSGKISYDFLELSQLKFSIVSGGSYSKVPYNQEEHEMYLIPLQLSWRYNFVMINSKIYPFFGSGIGGYLKMDQNEIFPKRRYNISYGYHFFTGLEYKISDLLRTRFEMRQNMLIPPALEDIDPSGLDILIGVGYKF